MRRYGRIDAWVNNAGVGTVGRFIDTPVEAHDQVIRTNLMGYIHGAHAALPEFLKQRAQEAIKRGHAGNGFGSLFEVLRKPE